MNRIFWNKTEERLRAGWRILAFVILLVLLQTVAFVPLVAVLGADESLEIAEGLSLVSTVWLQLVPITLAAILALKFLDRRPGRELGIVPERHFWQDLYFGLALGAFMQSLIFALEWGTGWVAIVEWTGTTGSGGSFIAGFGGTVVMFLAVGFYEELMSRGYLLRNLAQGLNFRPLTGRAALILGTIVSSAIFGFMHIPNPNSSVISTFNITLAGAVLALPYVLTGRLGASIGLHVTWNFFQGAVYGFPVSGIEMPASIVVIEQNGPLLWTGGSFGPEAGLVGLLSILLMGILIVWREQRRTGSIQLYLALVEDPERDPHTPAMSSASSNGEGPGTGQGSTAGS